MNIKKILMVTCLLLSSSAFSKDLTRVESVTSKSPRDGVLLLNQFVSDQTHLTLSIDKVSRKDEVGYKGLVLNYYLKMNPSINDKNINPKGKTRKRMEHNGNIRLYHNKNVFSDKPLHGVLLFIKFKNKVFSFPVINFHEKSFHIKEKKKLYLENVSVDLDDIYKGVYWLEVGLVDAKQIYGSRDAL